MIEGFFDYSNGSVINYKIEKSREESVAVHETIHNVLYMSTSLGILTAMIDKALLLASEYKWLKESLFDLMNRMQEQIAVTIEKLDVYSSKGYEEYCKAIDDFKGKTYFKHFRKMECIVQLIEKQDDVEDIIRLMIALGHIALDIDLANIPFEDMKSEKDVQRFFSNEENLLKYSPNKRFNVLVSVLFRQKEDVKMLEFVEKGSLGNVEWELEKSVNSAKKAVERIFQNDWRWERIHQRISTIGDNEIAYHYGENSAMMVLPIDLNKTEYDYNHKYLELGDFLSTLTQEQYANTIVRLEHHVGGFEEVKFLSLCDYKNKIVYVTFVTDEDLYLNIVSHISQTIVFIQTKLFRKLKGRIFGIVQKLPVYILIENNVMQSLEFIEKNFKGGKYCYIDEGDYVTLVVYRKKYVFIAYIVEVAKKEIDELFSLKYDIEFVEDVEEEIDKEKVRIISKSGMQLLEDSHILLERCEDANELAPNELQKWMQFLK